MKRMHAGVVSLVLVLLCSCGKKEAEVPSKPAAAPQTASLPPLAPLPDVGKVDTITATGVGYGASAAAATADAMKAAILQVNGASIDSGSVQLKYGLDVTDGKDSLSLQGSAFAQLVAQKSGGAITNFRIVEMVEPKAKGGQYKTTIEARIAHFIPPADNKRLKVVLAPIRVDAARFVIGSQTIPAQHIAEEIHQQVSTALTNTGRFSVLDREMGEDIDNELAMITSGAAPRAETGKLGQAVTADVIWIGTINSLGYQRHARQLRTSDRELVSYSGGWGVSQKLVNVATRQVMASESLHGRAPDVAPTTLGAGVNSGQVLHGMQSEIVDRIVASIVTRSFPITAVSVEGTSVVLSQGGHSVRLGGRYAMVTMGKEMRDPQTGQSLGRTESLCCEVVVDKVSPTLSYGHLENVTIALANIPPGALQLREQLMGTSANRAATEPKSAASTDQRPAAKAGPRSKPVGPPAELAPDPKEDGKW
jgi:curli biogenesis system outer membrane secretion channel CsgG